MSRRTTKCLTWGEMRRFGSPLVDENGRRVGMIDWADYITLCGRSEENPKDASFDHLKPRPVGVCPACWKKFRVEMTAAEFPDPNMPEGFTEKITVTTGPLDALLHPTGRCRCHGQGECDWCVSPFN